MVTVSHTSARRAPNWNNRSHFAFTLIELIVVIAIIAVLVSLLLPSLATARAKSQRTRCASNQHQIYAALMLYANDNNDRMPRAFTQNGDKGAGPPPDEVLQDLLIPYLGGAKDHEHDVWRCPGVKMRWLLDDPNANHYRYNSSNARANRMSDINDPSSAVILFDTAWMDWTVDSIAHRAENLLCAAGNVKSMAPGDFMTEFQKGGGNLESPLMTNGWKRL